MFIESTENAKWIVISHMRFDTDRRCLLSVKDAVFSSFLKCNCVVLSFNYSIIAFYPVLFEYSVVCILFVI